MTEKQIKIYERGVAMFKEKGEAKKAEIAAKVKATLDIDLIDYDDDMIYDLLNDIVYDRENNNLFTRFIMPPFTTLDTRGGDWLSRRNRIDAYFGDSLIGRAAGLAYGDFPGRTEDDKTETGKRDLLVTKVRKDDNGTSKFDSVLCEVLLKWFGFKGCNVLDPFAGGHIRGAMAAYLGYKYTGIDLSQDQIDANIKRATELNLYPKWICDDAINLDKYVELESQDLIFSCPPYGDLEQYTNDDRDLSNMEYADFLTAYRAIIAKSVKSLRTGRFCVFVVADFRDGEGFYRGFVADTIKAFETAGARLYNEAILLNSIGTAALRISGMFGNRKLAKVHQNVLVFFKGDPKSIKFTYGEVDKIMPFKNEVQHSLF